MSIVLRMLVVGCAAGCAATVADVTDDGPAPDTPNTNLHAEEVQLIADAPDWRAALVFDNKDVGGVWVVKAFPVRPNRGQLDVVGLDARGRLLLLGGYSGRWEERETIHEGGWLNGLVHADCDPNFDGAELYTGGRAGNLYQVVAHREGGAIECRLIARYPEEAINTLVAGDLRPDLAGQEIAVFTSPGQLHLVRPDPAAPTGFTSQHLQTTDSHSRDAVLLPPIAGDPPTVATVSANGKFELVTFGPDGAHWQLIQRTQIGMGRCAVTRPGPGEPVIVYVTCDDGRIYRHERRDRDTWDTSLIYAGPLGPRGVAAGTFDDDPATETVIVFGYSRTVELLTRGADGAWRATTIFTDRDKGHSLWACELDGRNGTDEVLCSGYGKRIVQLFRPPGYGRSGITAADRPNPGTIPEALK